jgi:hypothetical protein
MMASGRAAPGQEDQPGRGEWGGERHESALSTAPHGPGNRTSTFTSAGHWPGVEAIYRRRHGKNLLGSVCL